MFNIMLKNKIIIVTGGEGLLGKAIVSDIKSKTFETGVDTEVDAKLEYDNGIISEIKISIIKNLEI